METKKKYIRTLAIIILIALSIEQVSAAGAWKKLNTGDDVSIYERWVEVNDNLTVKQRRVEITVTSTFSQVLSVLTDPSKTPLWMENVSESYRIKKVTDNQWYSYTYFKLPWPLDNRDLVCRSTLRNINEKESEITMVSTEQYIPQKQDVKRFINYNAVWHITDLGKGEIKISLTVISYTSPEFPRIVQDPIVRNVFRQNMLRLKIVVMQ